MHDSLRLMTAQDILAATQLSAEAGWNQTPEDWRMLLELAPEGCFAIEAEGDLAATTTLVCYGRRLAWIGMVLTRQQYRGRGFARRLLSQALIHADRRKIESVKLDATDLGLPLYKKIGFRFEQSVERWTRAGTNAFPADADSEMQWHDDSEAFGADRSSLLKKLAARNLPLAISRSALFSRPGRQMAYLGPCVCENSGSARRLLEGALQNRASAWAWDILSENTDAVALGREFGFGPQRKLSRMVRGKDLRGKEDSIYAIAGFEFG